MKESITFLNNKKDFLEEKVQFLSRPESYPDTTKVEVIETHMSWVFITDRTVYKLKKPVQHNFLDFSLLEFRHKFCLEEVQVNKALADDTYENIVSLNSFHGILQLNGKGEPIDWLVKMKRLPNEYMLHVAIKEKTVRNDLVQQAAEKLTDFYMTSMPIKLNAHEHRNQIIKDIETNQTALLNKRFDLPESVILGINADLLRFEIKYADIFVKRIEEGRILDCHGDLRPEHICLAPKPVIIDRLEFDRSLRIMDVAEELSFLALECEVLSSPGTGQLFLNIYKWKAVDKIPDSLICFYKAKRALLRATLSINHLFEKKYLVEEQKWRDRCNLYLKTAVLYCERLPKDCHLS